MTDNACMSKKQKDSAPQVGAAKPKGEAPKLPSEDAIEINPEHLPLGRRRLAFLVASDRSLLGYLLEHGRLAFTLRNDAISARYVIEREGRLGKTDKEADAAAVEEVLEPASQEGTQPGAIELERTRLLFEQWKKTPNGKLFTAAE